jgi:hypothetical protein
LARQNARPTFTSQLLKRLENLRIHELTRSELRNCALHRSSGRRCARKVHGTTKDLHLQRMVLPWTMHEMYHLRRVRLVTRGDTNIVLAGS